ncbi:GNAT family N-acetyltransferase [Paenibacillus physcomitrellae]|uniref:N-acetyltransferase n=1 Tax=Paenibacillus physcomitrellae TaxID=1619311 RepID=A0ABQ1FSD7_9BACL|nr:GNAT family N-acetyltransferase [Paenibacillus physcomitrellae]GGA27601.1 N-acetyltransferase [Paenibacillus physcomitrellae]
MKIRAAVSGDEPGIAAVHVDSWRTTYRGLVPDAYLKGLSYEQRTELWKRNLAYPGGRVFVAEDEDQSGRIVGFISGGPANPAKEPPASETPGIPYDAELTALYLLEEAQGQGLGRKLVSALFRRLSLDGMKAAHVWVLEENKARTFYEHLGAVVTERETIEIGGKSLEELGLVWSEQAFTAIQGIGGIEG